MTFDKSILTNFSPIHSTLCIYTANDTHLVVTQCGDITSSLDSWVISHYPLYFIFLISIGKITDVDYTVLPLLPLVLYKITQAGRLG